MSFLKRLRIRKWRQFDTIDLHFDRHINILTGVNGSGKSSLLALLMVVQQSEDFLFSPTRFEAHEQVVGHLEFTNGGRVRLTGFLPYSTEGHVGFYSETRIGSGIDGFMLFLEAYRPKFTYQKLMPDDLFPDEMTAHAAMMATAVNLEQHREGQKPRSVAQVRAQDITSIIKKSLIFAFNNPGEHRGINRGLFNAFEEILRTLLPAYLDFLALEVVDREVVLVTRLAPFIMEAASGGIQYLMELVWRLLVLERFNPASIVLLDEPENHLHPEMQRRLLPTLLHRFPHYQFVVATHSPLVVTSVRNAQVFALSRTEKGRIRSQAMTGLDLAMDASDVLLDILGVDSTLPIWAEEDLKEITNRLAGRPLDASTLAELQALVDQRGLGGFLGKALHMLSLRRG